MDAMKKTKWVIGVTIEKGKLAVKLVTENQAEFLPRLKPDELEMFKSYIVELEGRQTGQSENLVTQKSKTISQEDSISMLITKVADIRNIVKNNSDVTPEIKKLFGVGEKTSKTVSSATAAANIIISAYKAKNPWSNNAGIIESDIVDVQDLISALKLADDTQEDSKYVKISKTMDKNQLQRAVEDEVSRISSLGAHIFRTKKPALAAQFEGLIPSTSATSNGQPAQPAETKV